MGKYDHQLHERDDDLSHCKVCGGAEGSLPTLCPGRKMTKEEEEAVYAAELDFNTGPMVGAQWWAKLSPKTPTESALEAANRDLKNALDSVEKIRQQLMLMEEHARGEVWRWQADGADRLESMGNRMGVLIYASDLRDLIAAPSSINVINALMAADEALKDSADTLRRLQDGSMAGQIESARMLITAALPATTPGFTISKEGWGTGWKAGEVITIKLDEPTAPATALDALLAYEAPPLTSDYDGFICELAMQHGAVLLNDDGSIYAFTQEQLIAFTKANRPAIDQLVKIFRGIGDQMYCDYINQMRRDVCLGWESKVHSRKFTAAELEGHTKAGELLGRHRAFHDAANALAQLGSQPVPAEAGGSEAATVRVPKKFIQEFMTLAHNYSLYAEAPDFYFGAERDAFQNAYRRCGDDLAKVKDSLTKSEQAGG